MERGSRDNITVIIVDISPPPLPSVAEGAGASDDFLSSEGPRCSSGGGGVASSHGGGHRDLQKSGSVGKYVLLTSKKDEVARRSSRTASRIPVSDAGAASSSVDAPQHTVSDLTGLLQASSIRTRGPPSRFKSSPLMPRSSRAGDPGRECSSSSSSGSSSAGSLGLETEGRDCKSAVSLVGMPSSDAGPGSDQDQGGSGSASKGRPPSALLASAETQEDTGAGDRDTADHAGALHHPSAVECSSAAEDADPSESGGRDVEDDCASRLQQMGADLEAAQAHSGHDKTSDSLHLQRSQQDPADRAIKAQLSCVN